MNVRQGWAITAVIFLSMGAAAQAEVISIDFNNTTNPDWVVTGNAGPLGSSNWNSTSSDSGGPQALVDDSGNATTASVTWSSSNTWTNGDNQATQDRRLAHAYLDDGGTGVGITVNNIPYEEFVVYGLLATDQSHPTYTTVDFQINGTTWILGEIINGNGAVAATATAYAGVNDTGGGWLEITGDGTGTQTGTGNYWTTQVLSGTTLTVDGQLRSGSSRGSITALIIQEVPEPSSFALFGIAFVIGTYVIRRRRS